MIGFAFTIVGGVLFMYVVARYIIQGGSVPGFPFLASMIAIFSGAQMFALGIIGEYLARMHFRSMERPTYVIREEINDSPEIIHPTMPLDPIHSSLYEELHKVNA